MGGSSTGGAFSSDLPKYMLSTMRQKYTAVRIELSSTTGTTNHAPASSAPVAMYHLLTNPTVRGTPIMDRAATVKAAMVSGILRPMPLRSLMSTMSEVYSTAPATIKRAPFIRAWFSICSMLPASAVCPATAAPSTI